MEKIIYTKTILLDKFTAKTFNQLLSLTSIEDIGYDKDFTIHVMTTIFDNGYFADIKICSGQTNFFGDAVLFNEHGAEVCTLDCFDDINDLDTFTFEQDNAI